MYILELIVSVRKVGLVIIVTLLAYYTATVMSCNGASYVCVMLSVYMAA